MECDITFVNLYYDIFNLDKQLGMVIITLIYLCVQILHCTEGLNGYFYLLYTATEQFSKNLYKSKDH